MLSDKIKRTLPSEKRSLNAPYGARCFLTERVDEVRLIREGLNAPYGARCFLTQDKQELQEWGGMVLMHLMALGAF